jgi:lia operon protein LiaG
MKQMKYILPLCIALFTAGLARAQEFKTTVENTKEGKLVLNGFTDNLPIVGYPGNEIIVTASHHEFEASDRAKGLKPIYAAGTDNTGVAVEMEKSGNRVTLTCLLPMTQGAKYELRVPDNLALEITRDCPKGGETRVENMKNEVEFKGCDDISLKNVTGPLVVSTINGAVNVTFSDINKDKPISITSVNGEVDVTMPAKAGFNLEMGTVNGRMFSDFDFPTTGDMKRIGGNNVHAQINGGGTDLKLHTVNGSVYLRKG